MGAEEICLTKTLVLYIFINIRLAYTVEHDIALSYSDPRGSPHVQSHSIVALSHELGCLNGFQSIGSATSADIAVSGHDVKGPDALVVHIGRLECAVAGVCECHCHIFRHIGVRVDLTCRGLR